MQGMITDPRTALSFILAGNAVVTLKSLKTGNHFTYKVEAAPEKEGLPPAYFVKILAGPDNSHDYLYMGMMTKARGFFLTAKSRCSSDSPSFYAIHDTMEELIRGAIPHMVEIWHEGCCGRCGRPLTVPESIATGLGPICAAQAMGM